MEDFREEIPFQNVAQFFFNQHLRNQESKWMSRPI
jgi:hypothetical protein